MSRLADTNTGTTLDLPTELERSKEYSRRLEEKVRNYAGRLQELETSVTEPRGTQSYYESIISRLKTENESLRSSARKIIPETAAALQVRTNALEKEKAELADSLRNETLVNEEQRSYIEMLKEALESKMNDLGLQDLLSRCKGGKNVADVFAEFATIKREVDTRRKEVEEKEGRVADIEGAIKDLRRENATLREQLAKEHEMRSQIASAHKDAVGELERHRGMAESEKKGREDLEHTAQEFEEYKRDAGAKLGELADKVRRLEKGCEIAQENVEAAGKARAELEKRLVDVESQAKEDCDKRVNETKAECEAQISRVEAEKLEVKKGLEARATQAEAKIVEYEGQITALKQSEKTMEEQKSATENELRERARDVEELKRAHDQAVSELRAALEEKDKELAETKSVMQKLEEERTEQVHSLNLELGTMAGERKVQEEKWRKDNDALLSSNSEIRRRLETMADEARFKDSRIADAQSELQKAVESLADLQEKYRAMQLELESVAKRRELDLLTNKRKEEDQKVALQRLRTQLESLKADYEEKLTATEQELGSANAQLQRTQEEFQAERDSRAKDLKELQEDNRKLREAAKTSKLSLTTALDEAEARGSECDRLKQELEGKTIELTELKEMFEGLEARCEKVQKISEDQTGTIGQMKSELADKQVKTSQLAAALSDSERRLRESGEALNRVNDKAKDGDTRLQAAKAKLAQAELDLKRATDDNQTLATMTKNQAMQIESLQADGLALKNECESNKEKVEAQKAEIVRLTTLLEDKSDQLSDLTAVLSRIQALQEEANRVYNMSLYSLIKEQDELFGKELRELKFPQTAYQQSSGNSVQWFDSLKQFYTLLEPAIEASSI